jgi:hypothetical protein
VEANEAQLSAGDIVGLLAVEDRRRVLAAVELGATDLDAIARAGGLSGSAAAKALGTLVAAGLVVADGGGSLGVVADVFQRAARDALARPRSGEHAGRPDAERKVMEAFVRDGRLTSIPASRSKRLVVLDWLAQLFEPGRRYSEQMVTLILGQRHPDAAALRRYLVDEGFLDRERGAYWRSGGTIAVDEPVSDDRR